jgi:hypothetical protein
MTSWKTTVVGCGLAIFQCLNTYQGSKSWWGYGIAVGLAAFGFLAKDFDTHSTEAQVQTATITANVAANTAALNAANKQ